MQMLLIIHRKCNNFLYEVPKGITEGLVGYCKTCNQNVFKRNAQPVLPSEINSRIDLLNSNIYTLAESGAKPDNPTLLRWINESKILQAFINNKATIEMPSNKVGLAMEKVPKKEKKDQWEDRWEVTGDSGSTYIVAKNKDGSFGCSCPAWKFQKKICSDCGCKASDHEQVGENIYLASSGEKEKVELLGTFKYCGGPAPNRVFINPKNGLCSCTKTREQVKGVPKVDCKHITTVKMELQKLELFNKDPNLVVYDPEGEETKREWHEFIPSILNNVKCDTCGQYKSNAVHSKLKSYFPSHEFVKSKESRFLCSVCGRYDTDNIHIKVAKKENLFYRPSKSTNYGGSDLLKRVLDIDKPKVKEKVLFHEDCNTPLDEDGYCETCDSTPDTQSCYLANPKDVKKILDRTPPPNLSKFPEEKKIEEKKQKPIRSIRFD